MVDEFGDWHNAGSEPIEDSAHGEAPHTRARGRKNGWLSRRRQPAGYPSTFSSEPDDPWDLNKPRSDPWDDFGRDRQTYSTEPLEPAYRSSKSRHQRRRRLHPPSRRAVALTAAAAVVAGVVAVGAPKIFGGNGEQRPAATASRTPGSSPSEHLHPTGSPSSEQRQTINPDVAELQQDYEDSHAAFQTGGEPFALGLTPTEEKELPKLLQEIDDQKLPTEKQYDAEREYEQLELKQGYDSNIVAKAEELEKKFDASFMGKVDLSSGLKLNFYIINNKSGRVVTIDAKALDAYFDWAIAHLADVYQPDGKGDDSARLAAIAQYQASAKSGELDTTMSIFLNPTPDQCFTPQDAIVPEQFSKKITTNGEPEIETNTNPSCEDLGFNYSGVGTSAVIGLNSISSINTRPTEQDPNGTQPVVWINGGPATLAVLLHEGIGHLIAQTDDLFPGGESDKNTTYGYSQDHLQLTNPITNYAIRFFSLYVPGKDGMPPLPITITKKTDVGLAS